MNPINKSNLFSDKAENPFEKHPELARLHKKMSQITDVKSHTILVLILRLRQFCCHPALMKAVSLFNTCLLYSLSFAQVIKF